MTNSTKQNLKIKLESYSQFNQAWDALIKLGYHCGSSLVPHKAPYLYSHVDGRILADFFDVQGADLSSPNSAAGYFKNCEHKEITLDELLDLAKQNGHEAFYDYTPLIKQERSLFEANYVKNGGGDLQFLKWDECDDGVGDYQPDWEKIGLVNHKTSYDEHEFGEKITEYAKHVQSCLMSWVECAKSKAIPEGYYLMPIQPCEKMLEKAELEFENLDIDDLRDRIVFSHQAMIQVACQSAK